MLRKFWWKNKKDSDTIKKNILGVLKLKQEYTDKLKKYQDKEYELFLKEKCVLDSRQFLHASLLYLNYAIITEKLYSDIGKKNIEDGGKENPFYNSVEILGWHYNAHTILNKLTLEWISHISNALDCVLQYVNSALHLEIVHKKVGINSILNKIESCQTVHSAINDLWNDENVNYIRSVYNYSKHTMGLYGGSSFLDSITGQRDVRIPDFKYRGTVYETKTTSELMGDYESFIEKYITVLDSINDVLRKNSSIPQRYHIGQVVISGHIFGNKQSDSDITLYAEFADDGEHIKTYWIENMGIGDVEIMMLHSKTTGQHFGGIPEIAVFENGQKIGKLSSDITKLENSTLQYFKYHFEKI